MKKIIIYIGLVCMFSISVFGIFEGQEFTQTQIDNFDTTPYYDIPTFRVFFGCSMVNNGAVTQWRNQWVYYKSFSCLVLEESEEEPNMYMVNRNTMYAYIFIEDIRRCINQAGRPVCKSALLNNLKQQAITYQKGILSDIENYQTKGSNEDLTDFNGGLW